MNNTLHHMESSGLKELECGCLCEVDSKGGVQVHRACPEMAHLFLLAGEKEPDSKYLFSPGDEIIDHVYDGITEFSDE